MKKGIIYKITNHVDGKIYIGKTIGSIKVKWKSHLSRVKNKSKGMLHVAIRKYGKDNFSIQPVWKGDANLLNEKEVYYIKHLDSKYPNGYNVHEGGEICVKKPGAKKKPVPTPMYYASIIANSDPPKVQLSTSLAAVSKFTGLNYSTLVYQFCRKGRSFYQRGDIMVFATGEIVRIDRPQYKNAFK